MAYIDQKLGRIEVVLRGTECRKRHQYGYFMHGLRDSLLIRVEQIAY